MKKIYQKVKKPAIKILAGAALIYGAIQGYSALSNGREIYKGPIGGFDEVVYTEGVFKPGIIFRGINGGGLSENRMTAKKGDIVYVFEDIIDETNIDWDNEKAPDFTKDGLERVSITTKTESEEASIKDINTGTASGKHAYNIISNSDGIYNNLRKQIREKLRSDYLRKAKSIEDKFK